MSEKATPGVTRLLERLVRGLAARRDVPHAILAVARGDGSFRWVGAAGEARPDGAPMREETPFFIASIDKLFTATVILKLRERGRLGLDEPMSAHLPTDLIDGLHRLDGVDHTPRITLRHLLGHTSGLPDWLEDRPRDGASVVDRLIREGDLSLDIGEQLEIVRDRLTPHFPPQPPETRRPKARYSDTNYVLLVAVIEAATGRPLHRVHEELLFRPLGLRRTWVAGHSTPFDPTLLPATLWARSEPLEISELMRSVRGVYSTVDDTLRFMGALVRGEIFDDPETPALMRSRWNRFGFPLDRAALRLPNWPIEYGLGIMRFHNPLLGWVERLPASLRPVAPVPAVVGHTGSTGSWLFHCPELDLLMSGTVDQVTAGAVPFRLVPKVLRTMKSAGGP